MKLSSQKDLLLVIIISLAVLTMSWLRLVKGDVLTFIQYMAILLLPGYAIMTAIWPTDERIGWLMRSGVGFVLGLFFVLFLPLIFKSLQMGFLSENLTTILLIVAVLLSLVAMVRRKEPPVDEISSDGGIQLTLEESIQRAAEMRQKLVEEQEDIYEDEEYPDEYKYIDEDSEYEEVPDDSSGDYDEFPYKSDEEKDKYKDLKDEKPLQYKRMRERGYLDEEHSADEEQETVPLMVEEPVKTEPSPSEYEEEMDRPVWMEEEVEKKPGFRNWDLFMILFLSGISLIFLYFNPLKTTTTSTIFFILLLFILGYTGLTIIFPDKSRVSSRSIILASLIIAIILFIISFLAWNMRLLPYVPKYLVKIIFVASIILVAGAFLRKWRTPSDPVDEQEEEIPAEMVTSEEEVELEEPEILEEKLVEQEEKAVKEPAPMPTEKSIKTDKKVQKTPPPFKPRNYFIDIVLIVVLTILTAAFVLIPPLNQNFIRTILGILLVLFIPGYSLIATLYPKWGELDCIERFALSFGLSIAVTPLIGLGLNYTPWGIRLDSILISLTLFTLVMCLLAYLRRKKLPEEERFFVPFAEFSNSIKGSLKEESRTEKILSIILIISIILAISTTVYIIVKPKESEKFTEFYILGPDGKASDYPINLTTGQNGSVIMGVVNHEQNTKNYQVMVKVNNTTIKNETITLNNNQKVEIPFNFTAGTTGQKKMEFLLYKLPDRKNTYRSLHLWLNITS